MNKNKIIEKTVSVDHYLSSIDGYPIYDLMQVIYVPNGHGQKLERWGASESVFYTTDETIIEKLKSIKNTSNLEQVKEFLASHMECIQNLSLLQKGGLELMSDKAFKAYDHLSSAKVRKETLKKGNYGVAHLIEDDKVLIFYQNHPSIQDIYTKGQDLNNTVKYMEAQKYLLERYKAGKITPDAEITGLAREKVMNALLDINFTSLTPFQKETVVTLKEFSDSVLPDIKFNTSIVSGNHMAYFTKGAYMIEVAIPKNKTDNFLIRNNGVYSNVDTLGDVLLFVNKEVALLEVNKFMKSKKM